MIDDSVRIDRQVRQAGYFGSFVGAGVSSAPVSEKAFEPSFEAKVIALADRLKPRQYDQRVLDLLPVPADAEWRRRTAGLNKLGQGRTSGRRRMRPANDRGRSADARNALPLQLLNAAVAAFGCGLVLAGISAMVLHSDIVPTLAASLQ